jgi:hypothetical protein
MKIERIARVVSVTLEQRIGERLARKMFGPRGNHSGILLSELALRDICANAARLGRIAATVPMGEVAPEDRAILDREAPIKPHRT